MSINKKDTAREAKAYHASLASKPTNLTPAPTYGNATTTGPLKAIYMASPRVEANDNQKYFSRDSGAQIVRCV